MSEKIYQSLLDIINNSDSNSDFTNLIIDNVYKAEIKDDNLVSYYSGLALLRSQKYFEAKQILLKLADSFPYIREYNLAISLLFIKIGDLAEALFYYKLSLSGKPHKRSNYMIPKWFFDPAVGIREIKRDPLLHNALASFYQDKAKLGIKLLIEQALLFPNDKSNWQYLADSLMLEGRQIEAYKARIPLINQPLASITNYEKAIFSLISLGLWHKVLEFSDQAIDSKASSKYILYANKLAKIKLKPSVANKKPIISNNETASQTQIDNRLVNYQPIEVAIFCGILSSTNNYLNWLNFLIYNNILNINFHLFYQANKLDQISSRIVKFAKTSNNIAKIDDITLSEIINNHKFDLILSFGYPQSGYYVSSLKKQNVYGFNLSEKEIEKLGYSGSINLVAAIDLEDINHKPKIITIEKDLFLTSQPFINKETISLREKKLNYKIISLSLPSFIEDHQRFKEKITYFLTNLDQDIKILINQQYNGSSATIMFNLESFELEKELMDRITILEEKQTNETVLLPLAFVDLTCDCNTSEYQLCNMMSIPVFAIDNQAIYHSSVRHFLKNERQDQFVHSSSQELTENLNKYLSSSPDERIELRLSLAKLLQKEGTPDRITEKMINFRKIINQISKNISEDVSED